MKKIISIFLIILLILFTFQINESLATQTQDKDGLEEVQDAMKDVGRYSSYDARTTGVGKVINNVIGIIQFVGSGIAIIVVSILGIRYLLASPNEKAEVKKMAMPIIIGCILLFGAVNLVGAIIEFSTVIK